MSKLTKIMRELTPEKMEEIRLDQIKDNKSKSLEYQLGTYIGEYIEYHYLPTLNIDDIRSRNIIKVSRKEKDKHTELEKKWIDSINWASTEKNFMNGTPELWTEYQKYYKFLIEKYLPKVLVCRIMPLNVENMEELKEGIIYSLWNSDICAYNLDPKNIKIYDDEFGFFTIVEFILDTSEEPI